MRSTLDGRGSACSLALALALGLALASGCKEFRSCTTDKDCESEDRCLPLDDSAAIERFCGRVGVVDFGTTPSACNSLQPLPVVPNPSIQSGEFGRQVFIGRVMASGQEQIQVLVASNKEAFLYRIEKEPDRLVRITGLVDLTDQVGMVQDNRVYFRGSSILRAMFSSMTSTDLISCSWEVNKWACTKRNVPVMFGADVTPATNGTVGFFGDSAKNIKFFDAMTVASTPNCDLSSSMTTGTALSRAIDIGPQHVGMLIRDFGGQAILTNQLSSLNSSVPASCKPQLLPQPAGRVSFGAIALGQDVLIAGGSGDSTPKVWSHVLSQGGTPKEVPICKDTCAQSVSALSLDGNRLAVGLGSESGQQGVVEVLQLEGGTWKQTARQVGVPADKFGSAVSISGEYLAVGAPGATGQGNGELRVFRCIP